MLHQDIIITPKGLIGQLSIPKDSHNLILFAHGSGSSRLSPRNIYVAEELQKDGFGTLLFDLLTEEEAADRRNVFDIPFLAERLLMATDWIIAQEKFNTMGIGYFGASTGAAAALIAQTKTKHIISAIVSRGGRPDLAKNFLPQVTSPTLLIVGGRDFDVIELNEKAYAALTCDKRLQIVPGATHLFEEPKTLDQVVNLAKNWFLLHMKK